VAVALCKAMGGRIVESKCRTRAIDDGNADGAISTRDLVDIAPSALSTR